MVGGFVEHKEVGAREEQRRQYEAAALAAGQAAHLPVEVVLPEQEQPEDAHELLFRHPGIDHAHNGDGFVLTVQVRLSALLNSSGNLLHFFRAGTGGEDALGGIIRIVEGEQPASQYHDE